MNVVILHGRLGKDPDVRTTSSGMTMARFSLAVDRYVKRGEERKADFISCLAFSSTADVIGKYCQKGKELLIQGHIQTGSYTTDAGEKRYTTDVIVDKVEFCGSRSESKSLPDTIPF